MQRFEQYANGVTLVRAVISLTFIIPVTTPACLVSPKVEVCPESYTAETFDVNAFVSC